MPDTLRWGILSTGNIANTFASDLVFDPNATIVAVGSRSQEAADTFGNKHNIPKRYGSYEALADDPDVDVIYIGTPHPFHYDNTLMCLNAGKHVLVEKPIGLSADQARSMITRARNRKLFLMEAMWTRFFPAYRHLKKMIDDDTLGDIRMIRADFSHQGVPVDEEHRLFNLGLGGGALLDIGIYPVAFAFGMAGKPDHITGVATIGKTGVDYQSSMLFNYDNGPMAILSSSMVTASVSEAYVTGTKGVVRIPGNWWQPKALHIKMEGEEERVLPFNYQGNGYQFEAIAINRHLRNGDLESDLMPLAETLQIMETMDKLRSQWGVNYPGEKSTLV